MTFVTKILGMYFIKGYYVVVKLVYIFSKTTLSPIVQARVLVKTVTVFH